MLFINYINIQIYVAQSQFKTAIIYQNWIIKFMQYWSVPQLS